MQRKSNVTQIERKRKAENSMVSSVTAEPQEHCLWNSSLGKCVSERDSVEPLQRDGDALKQEWSLTVSVADGYEAAVQLLKKFHAFDVNGSKRFERQWRHSLQRHQPLPMLDGGMSRRRYRWRSFLVAMEWGSACPVVFRRCVTVLAVPERMACLLSLALDV